jgi:tryptophan-rich sensory protein
MKHTQMANGHCAIAETSSFGGMAITPCLHWSMDHTLIKNPNCTIPAIAFMGVWPVLQVFMGVWTILSWEVHSAKI